MGLAATAALLLALGSGPLGPPDHVGFAVRYAPNVMERVAANRGIAPAPCMVAYTYARDQDMGQLWLHIEGPHGEADCLTVDLPRPGRDKQGLILRGVVAELDPASGAAVCGEQWTGRARDCAIEVWVIPE